MGQHTNWTVTYFEGNSGVPRYLNDCALDSLTSDSLRVMSNGTYHWLHLYYIYELSRPDEKHDFTRPMWVGAFIGGITGLVTSAFIEGNSSGNVDRGNPTLAVTLVFATVGGCLGLAKSIDGKNLTYRFVEIPTPEKRKRIAELIDAENRLSMVDAGRLHSEHTTMKLNYHLKRA